MTMDHGTHLHSLKRYLLRWVKLRRTSQNDETTSTTGDDRLAISGCSRFKGYRRKRLIRVKVLKMLSPRRSDSESTAGGSKDDENGAKAFLSTGRTGRRNALPDIHGRHAATGISDLPDRFGELSTEADRSMNVAGRESNQPSMSKQHVG
ncbi:uncharacterized protein LOC118449064 isoform X3 [Vespa mandarinia]|uniref:uncharacterized protein LOC118449064 isoform X3 n=1 Tax=Vespa mandarinia TaxID=7446 RepID=UPI001622D221|nr:uncharacterized protein LOC118449064 isoform X3 [Vespa mandarinia]